ncbi:hypothetical protein EV44_g3328 [Erysiphe necator]|uniref:Clr5 domain-containing protein n=1 Tax=Uncinula necator TaxID=52586 RepID=A0A0B1P2F5_UNCNE|nr:hypothetical protein EV44_g3328 [Erysiphe necator]
MVAVKKWLQQEVDKIFSLKYRDGMSECQITQYVAENFPSHRDVKISGVRYVLRCKRPSPGTPDDPKRSQAIIANNRLQCQISNQIASPKMNLQDGIMSQKRLQEQFLRRQNRLTMSPKKIPFQSKEDLQFNPLASPLLTSFQTPNQQLQNTKDEDMTSLMNFGNLESPGFSENFFNYALPELEFEALDSSDYYSETPDNISRNSSRDSAIKKFIKDSHLYSLQGSRINELVPTPNDVNESTNIQLSIPEASQNSFLNLNSVNQSTETCGNDLTFFNQPADDILKEFSFAEQAEFQGMPGLLDTSPCQNILDMPLNTNEEKNNTNVVFDDLSPDTCFEGKQNEEQQDSDCQQLASGNTGHYANREFHI